MLIFGCVQGTVDCMLKARWDPWYCGSTIIYELRHEWAGCRLNSVHRVFFSGCERNKIPNVLGSLKIIINKNLIKISLICLLQLFLPCIQKKLLAVHFPLSSVSLFIQKSEEKWKSRLLKCIMFACSCLYV